MPESVIIPIVEGLMEITALSLTDLLADEPAYE